MKISTENEWKKFENECRMIKWYLNDDFYELYEWKHDWDDWIYSISKCWVLYQQRNEIEFLHDNRTLRWWKTIE